jgi:NAD(P)-dependent dehydrogenase (short-subunit alcohol dehydrogenase family)
VAELPEMFNLIGRVALVTGGAGLLGTEFCRTLAEAGAAVGVADLNGESAAEVADSLVDNGHRAIGLQVDVTSLEDVSAMVGATVDAFGGLDILVTSAALDPKFDPEAIDTQGTALGAFEDYPLDAWKQALDVNLTGMFLSCQAAVKQMLAQGSGVIINVCSIYGLVGPDQRIYQQEGHPPRYKPVYYSVSKAGVLGLTRYLATYLAGKNIRVNALTPGGIYNNHDNVFTQAYSARTVLGRMAERNEMNGALLFLASEASAYMTGANLIVDGGWTTW